MKMKKWIAILSATVLLLSLILTACGNEDAQGSTAESGTTEPGTIEPDSDQGIESPEEEQAEEPPSSVPNVATHWTIEEAIENHMRFFCQSALSLYAVDTKLYASYNAVNAEGYLQRYANLVASNGASPAIRQIQPDGMFLDSNGTIWYKNTSIFRDYNITYFSRLGSLVAAVAEDGRVIWDDGYEMKNPKEQEGLESVKYIDIQDNIIAYVREDGTAGYFRAGKECREIEGWSDIAMIYFGNDSVILGLKKDGTLVAETIEDGEAHYSQDILSWTDIVYVYRGSAFIAGLKSDGSIVCALDDNANEHNADYVAPLSTWNNVMTLSVWGNLGAITTDGTLLEDAQWLVYAWDLAQPWEGIDAALQEHISDEENHRTYTEKLAEID